MSASSFEDSDEVIDTAALPLSVSPHPDALRHISLARFCERLAFYSMRHWLIVYMISMTQRGEGDTATFYGYYHWVIAAMAFVQVPGGLLIDLGYSRRKAVVWGGALLAIGYFLLALNHPAATAAAALSCLLGMAVYSPATYTLLGGYYQGRESYLTAGMYYHNGFVNLGAFLASLFIGFIALRLNWQQGVMLAAIVMMAGHVYLLAVARVFNERKLPLKQPDNHLAAEQKTHSHRSYSKWILPLTLIGFAFFCFAIQAGQNSANAWAAAAPGIRDWGKLGSLSMVVLGIFAAFGGSYLFTQQAQRLGLLLGSGFLVAVVAGVIFPGFMGFSGHGLRPTTMAAVTSFAMLAVVAAEFLVVAPMYSLVLAKGAKFKNTWIGGLGALLYLPYFTILFPKSIDLQSFEGLLFGLAATAVMGFIGVWLWKRG